MSEVKPAVKSLGLWGGATSAISLVYSIVGVLSDLPPDLFDDTKQVYALIVAVVGAIVALIGRWKAVLPIKGILK